MPSSSSAIPQTTITAPVPRLTGKASFAFSGASSGLFIHITTSTRR